MTEAQIELNLAERIIVSMLREMISTHSIDEVMSIIDNLARNREALKAYLRQFAQ